MRCASYKNHLFSVCYDIFVRDLVPGCGRSHRAAGKKFGKKCLFHGIVPFPGGREFGNMEATDQ